MSQFTLSDDDIFTIIQRVAEDTKQIPDLSNLDMGQLLSFTVGLASAHTADFLNTRFSEQLTPDA